MSPLWQFEYKEVELMIVLYLFAHSKRPEVLVFIYDVNKKSPLAEPCQAYYQFFWQSLDIFCVFSSSSSDLNCSKKTTGTSRFSHFWKLNAVNITEGRMGGTKNQVCRLKKSYSFDCIPLVPPLSWPILLFLLQSIPDINHPRLHRQRVLHSDHRPDDL